MFYIARAWFYLKSFFIRQVIFKNCDELPKYNFDKIQENGDLKWLVAGYNGYNDVNLPEDSSERWNEIVREYGEIIGDDKTILRFELLLDIDEAITRLSTVNAIIKRLTYPRVYTNKSLVNEYSFELRKWRFYLNTSKPIKDELMRMGRQLKAAETKVKLMETQLKKYEVDDSNAIDPLELKVVVQNIINRNINFKKISVKEWAITVKNAIKQKSK